MRSLLFRNLIFHWRSNLAVMLGVAVGTAVLTGALCVGDSLRGSMRDLTLQRLGRIDHALVSDRLFRAELANDLKKNADFQQVADFVAPALILRGTVLIRDADNQVVRRAGRVQVVGVDDSFWPLFGEERTGDFGLIANQTLARELNATAGTEVEVRLERPQSIPTDSLLGRPVEEDDEAIRIETRPITAILPDAGSGRFSLLGMQTSPLVLYVPLELLQKRLADADQLAGAANALLVAAKAGVAPSTAEAALNQALRATVTLEDLGLRLGDDKSKPKDETNRRYLSLESSRLLMDPEVVSAANTLADRLQWKAIPTLTYLANLITRPDQTADPGRKRGSYVPYSTVTGLDPSVGQPWGPFTTVDGQQWSRPLADDEILLNEWAARELWPNGDWALGKDQVRLQYFIESADAQLKEKESLFTLAGVLRMDGVAADPNLTPDFPGSANMRSISDWKAPFPKGFWHGDQWFRPRDNQYWKDYNVAPKAFVAPAVAQALWKSRHGQYTSVRFGKPADQSIEDMTAKFNAHFRDYFDANRLGLTFQPVKAQGLTATHSGTADSFGWLFLGFSFFLIVSAAMLVGLLFRLGVERRAKEIGLLMAEGYSLGRIRRLLLGEGLIVAIGGGLIGLATAIGYAYFLINLLNRWWAESLQVSFLRFDLADYAAPMGPIPFGSLVVGCGLSVAIALLTVILSLRALKRFSPRALLQGQATIGESRSDSPAGVWTRVKRWFVPATAILACALAIASFFVPKATAAPLFFGSGAALLAVGLGFLARQLKRERPGSVNGQGYPALARLGTLNAGRNPGRSLLTAGLLAAAVFLVIAVQAFRKSATDETGKHTGTGGFTLIAEADVPLPYVPDTPESRKAYVDLLNRSQRKALDELNALAKDDLEIFGFRVRPGDDVSCLNLYQPQQPRILGVPDALIERGGFTFGSLLNATAEEKQNPWLLLRRESAGEIPILADDHTAAWVLHKNVGDAWTIKDESGKEVTLRLVGVLNGSVFQSELLMAEKPFARLFPSRGRYGFFLVAPPSGRDQETRTALENALGLNVSKTADRLAAYQAVENTYLSTFQVLGGLGLLFGTLGLAVVLLRNVWERRGELALFRALGYSRAALGFIVMAENGFLLLAGLAVGVIAAALAIAPHLVERLAGVPWAAMLGLIALCILVGLFAGIAAVVASLRTPLLPALRQE